LKIGMSEGVNGLKVISPTCPFVGFRMSLCLPVDLKLVARVRRAV